MKFAHLADCHLGGWRQPELKELNFKSFQYAIDKSIKEKVDFLLIAGDLFDSAYPPIDTLKETFREFRKLKDANIPVFLIAGSHDYSVSGKTFLEVLEKSGFCKNVAIFEERNKVLILEPTLYKNVAIYGYPGKKSGLEVEELKNFKLQDAPGLFRILMLHTAIRDAIGSLPIKALDEKDLPKADYYALGHLHINYQRENKIYPGPIFPNSLPELEELKFGAFCIFENGKIRREEIRIKDVLLFSKEIKSTLNCTEEILKLFENKNLKDKIIVLRLHGLLEKGRISDIEFQKIEEFLKKDGAFLFIKSTSKVKVPESELKIDILDSSHLENDIIKTFEEKHPNKFNQFIPELMKFLNMERLEDEKSLTFEERIISESKKILRI